MKLRTSARGQQSIATIFSSTTAFSRKKRVVLTQLEPYLILYQVDRCCRCWQVFDFVERENTGFKREATSFSIALQLPNLLVTCLGVWYTFTWSSAFLTCQNYQPINKRRSDRSRDVQQCQILLVIGEMNEEQKASVSPYFFLFTPTPIYNICSQMMLKLRQLLALHLVSVDKEDAQSYKLSLPILWYNQWAKTFRMFWNLAVQKICYRCAECSGHNLYLI